MLHTLRGHDRTVNAAALTLDGRRAVSVSGDQRLVVWDLDSGEEIASFRGDAALVAVAAADDRTFVAGAGMAGVASCSSSALRAGLPGSLPLHDPEPQMHPVR